MIEIYNLFGQVLRKLIMAIDWYKYAILACRFCLCVLLIINGTDIAFDSGERDYNKYMHSLRKMYLKGTKPTDPSFVPGLTWNQLNLHAIQAIGGMFITSGLLILIGQKAFGGFLIIVASIIMAVTKDNPKIVSDVAAINREKDQRLEWFVTDVSMIGVALIIMGGMGSQFAASSKK